jgi:alcohol-forming fatty acyl-CoA reductase
MHAVLVEKILRVQPAVNKIYLLVRGIDEASAKRRVQEEVTNSYWILYVLLR